MIAISNNADWFAPTTITANEASVETSVEASVERGATDPSAQDFASLLAASYATSSTVVALPLAPSMTLESSVPSAPSIDTRQWETTGALISPTEVSDAKNVLPNESEVHQLELKSEPLNRIAVTPFEAPYAGQATAPSFAPAARQEFTAIAATEVTPAITEIASRDAVLVNAPTTPTVAPADAPPPLSSSIETPVARNDAMPVLTQGVDPASALPETPTSASRTAIDRSLSAPLINTTQTEPAVNLDQAIVTPAPANTPIAKSTAQSKPMEATTASLTEIRVATDQVSPFTSRTTTESAAPVVPITTPTIEMKAERHPINVANAVTSDWKAHSNSEIVASAPPIDLKVNSKPPIVATPAQSVIAAQNALTAMLEPSSSGVTAVVKMVAAVVKMIMAEPMHQSEILTTSGSTIASNALSPERLASNVEAASVPMTSVSVGSQPLSLEAMSPTLPASLRAPFDTPVTPEQTPSHNPETVEFPTQSPLSAQPSDSIPRAVNDLSRAVSYQSEAALAATATPLGEREVFTAENSESLTTPQATAVAASVNAPSPAASAAPPPPSSPIAQTMQPVLELAQRVPPQEARTLHFSLNPAELGRVDIEVTRDAQGRVSASLTVEQADTAQSLTHGIGQLRESLERAGMVVEHLQVTTQLQSQTTQQFNQQAGQQADQQQASSPYDPNADSLPADSILTDGTTSSSDNKLLSLHA